MMGGLHTYRNTRTGVCIQTPCVCRGADWQEVTPPEPEKPAAKLTKKTKPRKEAAARG